MLREGERVENVDGACGTVRYVGPVATSKDVEAVYYGTVCMRCLCLWLLYCVYATDVSRWITLQASSGTSGAAD